MIITDRTFTALYARLPSLMRFGAVKYAPSTWQGMKVDTRKEMTTYELENFDCYVDLRGIDGLDHWRKEVKPNLPWADNHFLERVCGYPINPGTEWENWPWASSAGGFIEGGMFNHNYMERYWPKYANMAEASKNAEEFQQMMISKGSIFYARPGIRGQWGDLKDLIGMLAEVPDTRKAYLPIFFPEDTGKPYERNPCTLGYQFRLTPSKKLNIWYPMRSCDLIRHFRDDIYLTIRLGLYVIEECRKLNPTVWDDVTLGTYGMHCTSLHLFLNDWRGFCGTDPK